MPLKRNFLKLKDKIEIIEKLEKGVKIQKLMSEYDIGRSTITKIRRTKASLMEYTSMYSNDRKNQRVGKLNELEKSLYNWFLLERIQTGQTPTGPKIKSRALFLKEQMCITDECNFSEGWIAAFRKRYGLKMSVTTTKKPEIVNSSLTKMSNNEDPIEIVKPLPIQLLTKNSRDKSMFNEHSHMGSKRNFSNYDRQLSIKLSENLPHPKKSKITWNQAEHYIEEIVNFFENQTQFSFQDCVQAHMLRNTFQLGQLKHRQQEATTT